MPCVDDGITLFHPHPQKYYKRLGNNTYTLPADPEIHNASGFLSSPLRNLPIRETSGHPQRKHLFGVSRHPKAYRNLPTEEIYIRALSTAAVFRSPFEFPDAEGSRAWAVRECLPFRTSNSGTKELLRTPNHQEGHTTRSRRSPAEATALQDSIGILHNDPIVRSCCACHVLVKEGCERRTRARQPRSGLVGATMGDLDGLGVGKGGRGGRRTGHQPPFLKTVSIIDTLSELGPEVRQLAEEPRSAAAVAAATAAAAASPPSAAAVSSTTTTTSTSASSKPPPPPPPPGGSASASSRSTKATPATVNASSAGVEPKEAVSNALGPPLVSADFQQYTEKIYDAVTRRAEPTLTARLKHHRGRHLLSAAHSERLKKAQNNRRDAEENGLRVRLEDEVGSGIKHRHGDQRGRERGRTPDWIKRIFDIAKTGDLEALKQGIADMEETLVRNLSDHVGNNLLHVMAVYGHLAPLAWMLTTHSVLVDALQDENKFGLTPLVCSIRYGRLHVVQWLVEKTVVKEKVKCKDGERSLLHIAAKYAQEEIVAWLVKYMMKHEIPLDNKDHHGNTALHLAARSGNSRLCSILLQHGADVTLKNDLGQKAWEVCVIRGHLACAEYLCVHESGLALATDLTRREAELEAAMADNHDLRINFKEVMSIARRLLREREESVRELSRLHEQMVETHDNVIALHAFGEDPYVPRDRTEGVGESHAQRNQVESVVAYVTNLHERWQAVQKTWFGSSLVNMKHKMLLVEEAWKKLRHRSHRTVATAHHPLDVFRGKLCAVRAQGGEGHLGDLPSLCSSEESLVSLFPFTDDDEVYDKDENYERAPSSSTPARGFIGPKNKFQSTELLLEVLPTRGDVGAKSSSSAIAESTFSEPFSPRHRSEDSLAETKETETTALSRAALSPAKSNGMKFGESSPRPYWTDPSFSASLSLITELSPGEQLPKEEINARLKELALTSESGSCTVLEVIEPSSEDSDTHVDDDRRVELQLGNPVAAEDGATNEPTKPVLTARINPQDRRSRRLVVRLRHDEAEGSGREATTSSESGADYVPSGEQQPNEGSSHASSDGKHFLVNETSVGTAAVDVSDKGQRPQESGGEIQDSASSGTGVTGITPSSATTSSSLPSASSATLTTAAAATTVAFKRKGFLHKLIKPPRWPSKRKVKTLRKFDPGNTRDFLDPYSHRSGSRSSGYSPGDVDPHTTPESNTSSSQEYSNSSEESSIGKPTSTSSSRPTELFQSYTGHADSENRPNVLGSNASQEVDKKAEKLTSHLIPLSTVDSPSRSSSPPPLPSLCAMLSATTSDTSLNTQGYHSDERNVSVKSIDNIQKSSVTEIRSIATSDDSGIVGRPASSASKSDSVSRPESSSSTFPPFKSDYSLQKSNLSLTQDMLPIPDSSAAGRMSPAPSEVSKTESALSPPSHASDVSKSESSRQTSLGKGSTNSNTSKNGSAVSSDYSVTLLPLKKDLNVKTAAIINISCDQKTKKPLQDDLCEEDPAGELTCSKKERPWYELSDEESDILLPDRLTSKGVPRSSSSEDEAEIC